MANWTAPFHLPKITDLEFDTAKEKYNKAHGYTIDVPAIGDIIQLKPFKPLTEQETKLWTGKIPASEIPRIEMSVADINAWMAAGKGPPPTTRKRTPDEQKEYRRTLKQQIPEERRFEISKEMEARRRRFKAMLGSPSPEVARTAGAILTAMDDLQDALSTLVCIGALTATMIGGTTAALIAGPLGWIAGGAAFLNLLNPINRLRGFGGKAAKTRQSKKDIERHTDHNPFSKKARAKYAKNIKKFKPSLGNAIEALQVTSGVFGVGISIGPIMGLAQDVISGAVRHMMGQDVKVTFAGKPAAEHVQTAQKAMKALAVVHGQEWKSDLELDTMTFLAANLATQVLDPYIQEENPFTAVEDLAQLEIEAPKATNPLTIQVIEEEGHTVEEYQIWPQNGKRWISLLELQEKTEILARKNLEHFSDQNKHSELAFFGAQNAHDAALRTIEIIEGKGSVKVEYTHIERIVLTVLDNGFEYPPDLSDAQREKFEGWCMMNEYMDLQPSWKEIWNFASTHCGFTFAKAEEPTT
jgi:hypothetical protein